VIQVLSPLSDARKGQEIGNHATHALLPVAPATAGERTKAHHGLLRVKNECGLGLANGQPRRIALDRGWDAPPASGSEVHLTVRFRQKTPHY
jgi:hypothetical protein